MVATLALVVILFDGGLNLYLNRILGSAHRAVLLVFLGTEISMAATAAFAYYLLEWGLPNSLLLGAIVSGTSPSIVMPLISRARVTDEISSVLSLASALNGALVLIIALVVLDIMSTGTAQNGLAVAGKAIAIEFSLGALVGVLAGILWLWVLTRLRGETYDDILTLAVVFLLYFIVESVNGSGVIFALVFGLVLGNGVRVPKLFTIRRTIERSEIMKKFHSQISFFIKTFFFIYLGLILTFNEPRLIILSIILSGLLLFSRYLAVLASSLGNRTLFANRRLLTTMLARGLSAAVVAQIVVTSEIPNASVYPGIIIAIILVTVLISSIGILLFARQARAEEPQ